MVLLKLSHRGDDVHTFRDRSISAFPDAREIRWTELRPAVLPVNVPIT